MTRLLFRLDCLDSFVLVLVVVLGVAACGGSAPPAEKPAPPPAPRTADDAIPMCKRIFARKATCANEYLPVLLDLHVELDLPPGIGERLKSEGRDAMLATAHTELVRDTEPAKVETLCESTKQRMPPERLDQLVEQGGKCEAAKDCKEFAVCVVEIDRGFIVAGARRR